MSNQPRHQRHEHNITAKAERAVTAIESLIVTRFVDDPALPEVTDLASGRVYLHYQLSNDDAAQAAPWWVAVGVEHDRLRGITHYGPDTQPLPTMFTESREVALAMLDADCHRDANGPNLTLVDPFAGLNDEPF